MNSATEGSASQASISSHAFHTVESYSTNPPLNLMGPEFVWQMREIVTELEKRRTG